MFARRIAAAIIAAAEENHPGPTWLVGDLARLDLDVAPFDTALIAGNVMVFVAPGTEPDVLARVASHVRTDGVVAVGFDLDLHYALPAFDDGDYAVTIARRG